MKPHFLVIALILGTCLPLPGKDIPAEDNRFGYSGILHTKAIGGGVELLRFSEETLSQKVPKSFFNAARARVTSGAVVRFVSDSPKIQLRFLPLNAIRQYQFAVYQDGKLSDEFEGAKEATDFTFEVSSSSPGKEVLYEIVLPSWANPTFAGITIADGSTLKTPPPDHRPLYAEVGDSISHGTGQQSRSDWTFPWRLAREGNWRLINFGIGGSTTSPALIPDVISSKPDIVTILWGYNDWQNKQFTLPQFTERYREVLEKLRAGLPETNLFCITPIATQTASAPNGHQLDEYREAVASIVAERTKSGDTRIFLIRGENLTSSADLGDGIHLTPAGAEKVAKALATEMKTRLQNAK